MLNLNLINELLKYSFFYYLHDVSVRAWLQKNTKHLLRLTDYVVHTFCIIYEYQKLIRYSGNSFQGRIKIFIYYLCNLCTKHNLFVPVGNLHTRAQRVCILFDAVKNVHFRKKQQRF
jgi:hypothetical protein